MTLTSDYDTLIAAFTVIKNVVMQKIALVMKSLRRLGILNSV